MGIVNGIDARRVRAVVFDLGGVFLANNIENVVSFGPRVGLPQEVWDAIRHEMFVHGEAWNRLERAEISLDEFADVLRRRVAEEGVEVTHEQARNFMGAPGDGNRMPLRQEIVDACLAIRAVMPTALLTNNIVEWRDGWRRRIDVDALFDVVVDSSEEGTRKPEPRIYEITERKLATEPEGLLFVDDLGVNLKTAKQRGWQTLKYVDTQEVVEVLYAVANHGTTAMRAADSGGAPAFD